MDPDNISEEFLQEALELLTQMEAALLDLESNPGDAGLINKVFRALHTLKGSSGMFGYEAVSAFAHHVETAFDHVRQGKIAPTADLIAVALRAQDYMRTLMKNPEVADAAAGEAIVRDLHGICERAPQGSTLQAAPEESWSIRMRFPRDHIAKGIDPLALFDELRSLGTAIITPLTEDIPGLDELDPAQSYIGWDALLTTSQPRSAIEGVFIFVGDDVALNIEPVAAPLGAATPDQAFSASAMGSAEMPRPAAAFIPAREAVQFSQTASKVAPAANSLQPTSAAELQSGSRDTANSGTNSIRVPAERLDELMNRVGELVIAQSRLRQIATNSADQQVKSVAEEIERLVLELRDTSMGIRMVPIVQLFGRFRRVVHDLSRDVGKQVELAMSGEETELDKTVIEQLNDPLVHLIRNAIDHGLEDVEGRAQAGKPQTGLISLSARHAGTEVLITITDDGRGLDRERIRARAEERGLIAPDEVVTDNELYQVLFLPGFSTAREVTNLSGRGVGMDVVKRTIESLRGKIDIGSTPGQGTQITLRLPLTLAIIDGLMVRIGQGRYVLPLEAVEECVELSTEEDSRSRGRSFLNIRGDLVAFLRLRELFGTKTPADRFQKVVVVSFGELKVGLVVDQVIGDHQTVIKSLSKLHRDVEMFSGATILGDGAVALILDVPHLVEYGQVQEERLKAAG